MHRHHDDDVRQILDDTAAGVSSHRLDPERLTIAVPARRRQRRLLQAGSTVAVVAVAALTAAVNARRDACDSPSVRRHPPHGSTEAPWGAGCFAHTTRLEPVARGCACPKFSTGLVMPQDGQPQGRAT